MKIKIQNNGLYISNDKSRWSELRYLNFDTSVNYYTCGRVVNSYFWNLPNLLII